jgi:hypothetical protein
VACGSKGYHDDRCQQDKFERVDNGDEFALIFKIVIKRNHKAPVWVICGQTAMCNQAAARYLRRNLQELRRRYNASKPFCIALRVVNPRSYGFEHVEEVGDMTDAALRTA